MIKIIKLPIFHVEQDKNEQLFKVLEETIEVIQAYKDGESIERQLEECMDSIQATTNYMHLIATDKEIDIAVAEHFKKMKNRDYEFKGYLEIKRN